MINHNWLIRTLALWVFLPLAFGQSNIHLTNGDADKVLKGNYTAADYASSTPIRTSSEIVQGILERVSPDTLEALLKQLVSYHNRNTGSDTTSQDRGIGAARRWIHSKFEDYSAQNENRLLVSYLNFDQSVCGMGRHANVMGILPGADPENHSLMIIQGHMDSRCESGCDITCKAHGADDNGSGTVLVMEAARLLSRYTFDETIIFTTLTGEEQGTYGAAALAKYVQDNSLPLKAVQNNDVSGGIECGPSASPPGCSGDGSLDSTNIRIFSTDINFSKHKAFARYLEQQYEKFAKPLAEVPMTINIMDPEDRSGRGGDHQPFAERGYTAIRITEMNEHGDGGSTSGRQHTTQDVIGLDANSDGVYEEYYVNFNYLSRNVVINAMGLSMAALAPNVPAFTLAENSEGQIQIIVTESDLGSRYIVGIRTDENSFDYTFVVSGDTIPIQGVQESGEYFVALAALDSNNVQSLFSQEQNFTAEVDGPATVFSQLHSGPMLQLEYKSAKKVLTGSVVAKNGVPRGEYQFLLRNTKGEIVLKKKLTARNNRLEFSILAESFNAGIYYGSLVVGHKTLAGKRVVVTK